MARIGITTEANRGLPKNLHVNFITTFKAMLIKINSWMRLLGVVS
jgi:hypothetical protein